MIKIILDTNFLVYCAEKKIDYAEELMNLMSEGYELVVPEQVVEELKDISQNSKKLSDRSAAFLALKLLGHNKVKTIKTEGIYADEAILNLVRLGNIVATLDVGLRKKLKTSRKIVIIGERKLAFE